MSSSPSQLSMLGFPFSDAGINSTNVLSRDSEGASSTFAPLMDEVLGESAATDGEGCPDSAGGVDSPPPETQKKAQQGDPGETAFLYAVLPAPLLLWLTTPAVQAPVEAEQAPRTAVAADVSMTEAVSRELGADAAEGDARIGNDGDGQLVSGSGAPDRSGASKTSGADARGAGGPVTTGPAEGRWARVTPDAAQAALRNALDGEIRRPGVERRDSVESLRGRGWDGGEGRAGESRVGESSGVVPGAGQDQGFQAGNEESRTDAGNSAGDRVPADGRPGRMGVPAWTRNGEAAKVPADTGGRDRTEAWARAENEVAVSGVRAPGVEAWKGGIGTPAEESVKEVRSGQGKGWSLGLRSEAPAQSVDAGASGKGAEAADKSRTPAFDRRGSRSGFAGTSDSDEAAGESPAFDRREARSGLTATSDSDEVGDEFRTPAFDRREARSGFTGTSDSDEAAGEFRAAAFDRGEARSGLTATSDSDEVGDEFRTPAFDRREARTGLTGTPDSDEVGDEFRTPAFDRRETRSGLTGTPVSGEVADEFRAPAPDRMEARSGLTGTPDGDEVGDKFRTPAFDRMEARTGSTGTPVSGEVADEFRAPAPDRMEARSGLTGTPVSGEVADEFRVPAPDRMEARSGLTGTPVSGVVADEFRAPAPDRMEARSGLTGTSDSDEVGDEFQTPAPERMEARSGSPGTSDSSEVADEFRAPAFDRGETRTPDSGEVGDESRAPALDRIGARTGSTGTSDSGEVGDEFRAPALDRTETRTGSTGTSDSGEVADEFRAPALDRTETRTGVTETSDSGEVADEFRAPALDRTEARTGVTETSDSGEVADDFRAPALDRTETPTGLTETSDSGEVEDKFRTPALDLRETRTGLTGTPDSGEVRDKFRTPALDRRETRTGLTGTSDSGEVGDKFRTPAFDRMVARTGLTGTSDSGEVEDRTAARTGLTGTPDSDEVADEFRAPAFMRTGTRSDTAAGGTAPAAQGANSDDDGGSVRLQNNGTDPEAAGRQLESTVAGQQSPAGVANRTAGDVKRQSEVDAQGVVLPESRTRGAGQTRRTDGAGRIDVRDVSARGEAAGSVAPRESTTAAGGENVQAGVSEWQRFVASRYERGDGVFSERSTARIPEQPAVTLDIRHRGGDDQAAAQSEKPAETQAATPAKAETANGLQSESFEMKRSPTGERSAKGETVERATPEHGENRPAGVSAGETKPGNQSDARKASEPARVDAWARLADAAEIPSSRPAHTGPVRDVHLRLEVEDKPAVRVSLSERGGEIRVAVHSSDGTLRHSLNDGVSGLVETLEKGGYQATVVRTETNGDPRRDADANQQQQQQQQRQESGPQHENAGGRQQRERNARRWLEQWGDSSGQ